MKMKYTVPVMILTVALCVSCASLQKDLLVTSADETANSEITALENLIVPLDNDPAEQDVAAARAAITALERKGVKDAVYEARLAAWSGRLCLLEGRAPDAEKLLKRSVSLLPQDIPGEVLAARLERDAGRRLALIDSALAQEPSGGPLLIERARTCLELKSYRDAVAAFDTAFPSLDPLYGRVYASQRQQAWDARDLASDVSFRTAAIVSKNEITWRDAIDLARTEAGLLAFLTAGKDWSAEKIFPRLLGQAVIPPVAIDDSLTRAGAAWFVWHLTAEARGDRLLLTRYSARYRTSAFLVSPVSDVPLGSPFFDSVMGCIEWEILSLPDGKSFWPDKPVKGAAFLQMLKKTGQ